MIFASLAIVAPKVTDKIALGISADAISSEGIPQ
jgi:hypothetical protein